VLGKRADPVAQRARSLGIGALVGGLSVPSLRIEAYLVAPHPKSLGKRAHLVA
jgi:hypothetical protein